MTYDLGWLYHDGFPGPSVPLGLDAHYELIQFIKGYPYPLLSRLSDYYEDAYFANRELADLKKEVESCLTNADSPRLRKTLLDMLAMINDAISRRKSLYAICD